MPVNMDGVGDFVDRIDACFEELDLGDGRVFVVEEGGEYVLGEEIKATVHEMQEEVEGLPVFTVNVRGHDFKVFMKPMSEEAQIIKKLSSPNCQPIVSKFKEYHIHCVLSSDKIDAFWL